MRIPGSDDAHLTYCLNAHPGDTRERMERALYVEAPKVFREFALRTGVRDRFGLGPWISDAVSRDLEDQGEPETVREKLAEAGLYVFTLNGFPYGRFHGAPVKEAVYRPDWSTEERQDYTERLASILARLLPPRTAGSISTLPVTYRAWADEDTVSAAIRRLAETAYCLSVYSDSSQKTLRLALEPEPDCFLDETAGAIDFFLHRLIPEGAAHLKQEKGIRTREAEALLREHLGICLDTVHSGVLGESPAEALRAFQDAGISVAKIQLGAALTANGSAPARDALRPFDEPVYLHQTRVRTEEGNRGYTDLGPALESAPAGDWRVHFHVPLAWSGGTDLASTAADVDEAFLRAALAAGVKHFEVEIYTLSVFPEADRDLHAALAEDLALVYRRLES